ncbi:histidine phosphatase family protein [Pseudooceanicola sediminis]|uniref:histidine phosphatase family protein n=1 Tax=Pseudooceanicola sediminis TaxID=2211117 RepID=UPI00131446A5|nr:histidine phosphatase family protein [Pseudooceanicola sediminis]
MPVVTLRARPFVLIRHGQTDANRDHLVAGRTEAQLTQVGRRAAQALSGWEWPADTMLFVSPQQRARETARLAFPHHSPVLLEGLRERDWGLLEGRPVSQLLPRDQTPEQGEAWPDMIGRVCAAIAVAQDAAAGRLPVCVAHSGVIRAARHLTGGAADGPSPANTTPYLFSPTPEGWRETLLEQKDTRWIA